MSFDSYCIYTRKTEVIIWQNVLIKMARYIMYYAKQHFSIKVLYITVSGLNWNKIIFLSKTIVLKTRDLIYIRLYSIFLKKKNTSNTFSQVRIHNICLENIQILVNTEWQYVLKSKVKQYFFLEKKKNVLKIYYIVSGILKSNSVDGSMKSFYISLVFVH